MLVDFKQHYSGSVAGDGFSLEGKPVRFFGDAPNRDDPQNDHTWDAELWLAKETREPVSLNKKVTLYNGISWGWRNETFGRVRVCKHPLGGIDSPNIPNDPDCLTGENALDLVIVVDTTGSIGGYINAIKQASQQIIDLVFSQMPNSRIAVVDYKDFPVEPFGEPIDYPYRAILPFSRDKTS